jgi:hypothetical protein
MAMIAAGKQRIKRIVSKESSFLNLLLGEVGQGLINNLFEN